MRNSLLPLEARSARMRLRNPRSVIAITLTIAALCVLLLILGGRPFRTPSASASSDPLDQFKGIASRVGAARGSESLEDTEPVLRGVRDYFPGDKERRIKSEEDFARGVRWRKFYYWVESVTYDVRKTDSLVSPFVATMQFKCIDAQSPRLLKQQADQAAISACTTVRKEELRLTYAFQEGRWALRLAEHRTKPDQDQPIPAWVEYQSNLWPEVARAAEQAP
jgi:hypothetical protein